MSAPTLTLADILSQFSDYLHPEDILQITSDLTRKFPLDSPVRPHPEMSFFRLDASDPDHPLLCHGNQVVEELDPDSDLLDRPDDWAIMEALQKCMVTFHKRHPNRAAAMNLRFLLHVLSDMFQHDKPLTSDMMPLFVSGLRMAIDYLEPRDLDAPGSTPA